ncbi:hypothetical protein L7F22_026905 [Adiantum nelumboides]|nr:hypothetical protein [Adiantum nelumboides]
MERAYGIMKSRFRILLKRCDMLLSNVPKMVATCMVLHNMCIIHGDAFDEAWMVCRAQRDGPLEGTTINEGRSKRDNIAKVMFKEHHNKALQATFGNDSADETYGSSSDDDV